MFQKKQKNVPKWKLLKVEQKIMKREQIVTLSLKWQNYCFFFVVVAIDGHVWPCTTKHGIVWAIVVLYDLFMVFYGLLWKNWIWYEL